MTDIENRLLDTIRHLQDRWAESLGNVMEHAIRTRHEMGEQIAALTREVHALTEQIEELRREIPHNNQASLFDERHPL